MKTIVTVFWAALLSVGIAHAAKPPCDAGALDTSFGSGGSVALTQPTQTCCTEGFILDSNDRTVVPVGWPVVDNNNFVLSLVRTNTQGLPSQNFGVNGLQTVQTESSPNGASGGPTTLAQDASGRILFYVVSNTISPLQPVAGNSANLIVYRLLANGKPDSSFGTAGTTVIYGLNSVAGIVSMATDANSRVLIALSASDPTNTRIEATVLRLAESGVLDSTFGTGGMVQVALGTAGPDRANDIQVQADGRIIVIGRTQIGTLEQNTQNKIWDIYAMRFMADGTLDTSYGTNGSTIIDFGNIAAWGRKGKLQPDGKLVIAANTHYTGLTAPFPPYAGWVRLNTDGSLDTTFGTNGQARINIGTFGGTLWSLALQNDGKIVGGLTVFRDTDGNSSNAGVMRINADGTLDSTYAGTGVATAAQVDYQGFGASLRVDSKNRTVASYAVGTPDGLANPFLARFLPGKPGLCN